MIKFKKTNIDKGVQSILLFLGIMGIAFYLFSSRINYLTNQTAEERLTEVAHDNVQLVNSMFSKDIYELQKIAKYWESSKDMLSDESLSYLRNTGDSSNYVRIALDFPDQSSYTSDGYSVNISDLDYLDKVLAGYPILTELFVSKIDKELMFAVVVPVYQKGEVVAALRGVYRRNVLEDFVKLQSFGGYGYTNIISSSGNFLIKSDLAKQYHSQINIFEALKTVEFSDGYSIEQLQQALSNQENGFTEYTLSGITHRAYFTPVGLGNWYVFAAVPTEHLLRQKSSIDAAAILLLLLLCLLFGVLVKYIVNQNRKARTFLLKDKEYFERVLNSIPLPVFITTEDRLLSFVNKAAIQLFKCKQDMTSRPCHEFNTAVCNTKYCAIEKMEREGISHIFYEDDDKSYQVNTALLSGEAMQDGKYIEVIQDITEIVRIQKTLEEKTLELETINENLSGGLLITKLNDELDVIHCNKGYTTMLMREEDEIIGFPAFRWILPKDLADAKAILNEQLKNKRSIQHAFRLLRGDGNGVWVSLHGNPATLNGKPVAIWLLTDISDIRKATQALRINEERYRIAISNTEDIIIDYDLNSHTIFHSHKAQEIYGVPDFLHGAPQSILESGIILPDSEEIYLDLFYQIGSGKPKSIGIIHTRTSDGRTLWNRLTLTTIFDSDGLPLRAIGIFQDITHEKEVERQYKRETMYRELSDPNVLLYYEVNMTQHRFISGHEALVKASEETIMDDFDTVVQMLIKNMVFEPDRELVRSHIEWDEMMRSYEAGITRIAFEYRRIISQNPTWVECAIHIFLDEESGSLKAIGSIKDINEAKLRELAFQQKAERDLMTGLLNKVTSEHLIQKFISNSTGDEKAALLLIDLDNFKKINDTMGHAFGDTVLSEVSTQMLDLFGETDIIGRLGGDEFVVFVRFANDKQEVVDITQQLCELFRNAYIGEEQYKISVSIGIALFPEHGKEFQELYKKADLALYYAKDCGKDTFAFYSQSLSKPKTSNV